MIREIDYETFNLRLKQSYNPILVILNLNYEDRTLACLQKLISNIQKRQIIFIIIELRTSWHVDILEERIELNRKIAKEIFDQYKIDNWNIWNIEYPLKDLGIIQTLLESSLRFIPSPIDLLLDISCMPRELILAILDNVIKINKSYKIFNSILAIYVWAKRYPCISYPQAIGLPRGYINRGIDLGDILRQRKVENIILVIFPGSQGFEGKQVYDAFAEFRGERYVLFFVNRNDPWSSLPTHWANQSLVQASQRDDTFIEYYFTISDGMRHLKNILQKAKEKSEGFFIAPFGPKPLTIGSFLIIREFLNLKKETSIADIILLSSFQYTSTYSIGVSETSIFEINITL